MAGGGIGEAALLGAAFGGAKAIATGDDPLQGALLGGVTGGAMSGITNAMFANVPSEAVSSATTPEIAKQTAEIAAANSGNIAAQQQLLEQGANTGLQNTYNPFSSATGYTGAINPNLAATNVTTNQGITGLGGMQANTAGGWTPGTQANLVGENIPNPIPTQTGIQTAPLTASETSASSSGLDWYNKPGLDLRNEEGIAGDAARWWGKQGLGSKAMYSGLGGLGYGMYEQSMKKPDELPLPKEGKSPLAGYVREQYTPSDTKAPTPYPQAQYVDYYDRNRFAARGGVMRSYAEGGIAALAGGGDPVNFMGGDMYPQSQLQRSFYATPSQMPTSAQQAMASYEPNTNPLTGQATAHMAAGGIAGYNLGGYADGGNPRLLKGPGDGMSDNIPATIGGKQPARLADGEFVVPADVVSHLGNGSTDAGAKHLYAMMNKVRKARTGSKKQGKQINPNKFLPA